MNKVIKVMTLVLILVVCFSVTALAGSVNIADLKPAQTSMGGVQSGLNGISGAIIGTMQVIATIVAISVLLYVGIKFLLASPAEKANIKGMLIPYVIGAVLIFATVPILGIIQSLTSNISDPTQNGTTIITEQKTTAIVEQYNVEV